MTDYTTPKYPWQDDEPSADEMNRLERGQRTMAGLLQLGRHMPQGLVRPNGYPLDWNWPPQTRKEKAAYMRLTKQEKRNG